MKNREPDVDVQPEDWERESSEPRDLGIEDHISIARADERIKAIQAQLIKLEDTVTRIESDFEKHIERLEGNHNQLVKYLWGGIGLIFTAAVSIIIALISRGN